MSIVQTSTYLIFHHFINVGKKSEYSPGLTTDDEHDGNMIITVNQEVSRSGKWVTD